MIIAGVSMIPGLGPTVGGLLNLGVSFGVGFGSELANQDINGEKIDFGRAIVQGVNVMLITAGTLHIGEMAGIQLFQTGYISLSVFTGFGLGALGAITGMLSDIIYSKIKEGLYGKKR